MVKKAKTISWWHPLGSCGCLRFPENSIFPFSFVFLPSSLLSSSLSPAQSTDGALGPAEPKGPPKTGRIWEVCDVRKVGRRPNSGGEFYGVSKALLMVPFGKRLALSRIRGHVA